MNAGNSGIRSQCTKSVRNSRLDFYCLACRYVGNELTIYIEPDCPITHIGNMVMVMGMLQGQIAGMLKQHAAEVEPTYFVNELDKGFLGIH